MHEEVASRAAGHERSSEQLGRRDQDGDSRLAVLAWRVYMRVLLTASKRCARSCKLPLARGDSPVRGVGNLHPDGLPENECQTTNSDGRLLVSSIGTFPPRRPLPDRRQSESILAFLDVSEIGPRVGHLCGPRVQRRVE